MSLTSADVLRMQMKITAIISRIKKLNSINLVRTLLLNAATGQRGIRIFVYPRVRISKGRNYEVRIHDRFYLGATWPLGRYYDSELKLQSGAMLKVEGCFHIYTGHQISINKGAVLSLGSGYINSHVSIDCFESIKIGYEVAIAKGVVIRDCDNHSIDGKNDRAPVTIGDRVWIGTNVIILKGVSIGKGAVIAAGAVVVEDIPPNCLAGGVPARVIRKNVHWK